MATQVLVPVDGSEGAWNALDYAVREHPDAALTLLHVINPIGTGAAAPVGDVSYGEEWYESAEHHADDLFEMARERIDRPFETDVMVGRPARAIVEFADEHPIDTIVMGSHGRDGVSRIVLGSVAETVVRRSPVPVTVAR